MTYNLIIAAKGLFDENAVTEIASFLGESKYEVSKALEAALPVVLGVFTDKVSDHTGASAVLKMINNNKKLNEIEDITVFFEKKNVKLFDKGMALSTDLLASKKEKIIAAIAFYSGMNPVSVKLLLGLVAPSVLGLIGKHTKEIQMDTASIHFILFSQKNKIASTVPDNINMGELVGGIWQPDPSQKFHHSIKEQQYSYMRKSSHVKPGQIVLLMIVLVIIVCLMVAAWYLFNSGFETVDRHAGITTPILNSSKLLNDFFS